MPFPLIAGGAIGLGSLLGGLGSSQNTLPSWNDIRTKFGPQALTQNTLSMYNMLAASPQFRQALNQNALAGANLSNSLNANLGKRGLNTTGIGTIASSMGGSAAQFGQSALQGGLFGQAGDMAQNNLNQLLQAYMGIAQMKASQPNFLQQLGSGLLTGGSALATYRG